MKNLKTISLVLLAIVITACSKDDEDKKEFDGSVETIENFFSAEVLQTMEDFGFVVHEGNTPPNISGEYLLSQTKLEASNMPNDVIGRIYTDIILKFSNQENENLSLDYEQIAGTANSVGVQSFISGKDDNFSVFIKVNNTLEEHTSVIAVGYSGKLLDGGIENIQYTIIMLDDKGDPNNNLIGNNTGRLFIDSDGFSPKQ